LPALREEIVMAPHSSHWHRHKITKEEAKLRLANHSNNVEKLNKKIIFLYDTIRFIVNPEELDYAQRILSHLYEAFKFEKIQLEENKRILGIDTRYEWEKKLEEIE
jgi:hypothetical protein